MKIPLNVLIFLTLGLTTCFTQANVEPKVVSRISVRQHSYYAPNVLPALKEIVAERGKSKRNHFYVGRVEVYEDGSHSVLVYWKESRALILWEPGRGRNSDPRFDLQDTRRYWELDKDVVPTLNDVGGSSFLITRKEARRWVRDCVRYGTRYVVDR